MLRPDTFYNAWKYFLTLSNTSQRLTIILFLINFNYFLEKKNIIDFKKDTSRWYIILKNSRPLPEGHTTNKSLTRILTH